MNALTTLLASLGTVVALAAITVLILWPSFRKLLVELCGSASHGHFWFAFSSIAIVLTSLFGALFAVSTARLSTWDADTALEFITTSFRAGLFALLLSLASVALGLVASIATKSPPAPPVHGQPVARS